MRLTPRAEPTNNARIAQMEIQLSQGQAPVRFFRLEGILYRLDAFGAEEGDST